MKWMRERDLLIAQTMAFVESVTGKKPLTEKTATTSMPPRPIETSKIVETSAPMPEIEALLATSDAVNGPEVPNAAPMVHPDLRNDFQAEIKARVANFRAHQERFSREREAYCSATMAKVHAALKDGGPLPRLSE